MVDPVLAVRASECRRTASDLRVAVITACHLIFTVSLPCEGPIAVNGGRDGNEEPEVRLTVIEPKPKPRKSICT